MVRGSSDATDTLLTGGSDGRIVEWSVADGNAKVVTGEGHSNQINGLRPVPGSTKISSVGIGELRLKGVWSLHLQ